MGKKAVDVIVLCAAVTFLVTTVALFIFCITLRRRVARLEILHEHDRIARDRGEREALTERLVRWERDEKVLQLLQIHGGTRCFDRVHVDDADIAEARALLEEARDAFGREKDDVEPTIVGTTRRLIEIAEASRRGD